MKTIKYITGTLAALILFNGCNDWLDVNPRSQVKESVLIRTEDGFKQSLTGAYILIGQAELYGKNTSMYIPELLAQNWTLQPGNSNTTQVQMNQLANFDYTHSTVEGLINTVWLKYYKVIAQLNSILQNLENTEVRFQHNNDALIKGEALGLRAFLHLDVLRYFGPVPSESDPEEKVIPYAMEMSTDPWKFISIPYSEVLKKIEADLNEAEKLLEKVDPILFYTNDALNGFGGDVPEERWQRSRQERFNYYAVLGAKARFYQWIGNKEKATVYAKKVVEAKNINGRPVFPLATEDTYSNTTGGAGKINLIMRCEHLFGAYNTELPSIIEPLFKSNINVVLTQAPVSLDVCYEYMINPNDIRYKPSHQPNRYWETTIEQQSIIHHFRKYGGNGVYDTGSNSNRYRIPVLRVAEMYFILMENLSLEEAIPYFSDFRFTRGMDASTESHFETARMDRLELEYRKEFFGEGQMFFFYKRFNYRNFTWPDAFSMPTAASYALPRPKAQTVFE